MNSENVVNLGDPSGATDANNKKYVDTTENNILNGSKTFQGDIDVNNNGINNLHVPTSKTDAFNKI